MSLFEIGERKAHERGIETGLRETLSDILEIKFSDDGLQLFERTNPIIGIEALRHLRSGLKKAASLQEAKALINEQMQIQLKASGVKRLII